MDGASAVVDLFDPGGNAAVERSFDSAQQPRLDGVDCVEIGDFAVINMQASPQTHLDEDRVMKAGRIKIGRGVTIGTDPVTLSPFSAHRSSARRSAQI
jgi:acetyltransferase-like isoleucine patch superfamily enzyme